MVTHQQLKWIQIILPLTIFCILFFYSLISRQAMVHLYARTSYYIIFLLCTLWMVQFIRYLKSVDFFPTAFVRTYWTGILISLVLTAVIFLSVPVGFKILNDETNLLAVSQSMTYHKEAYRIFMGKYYYGALHPVGFSIPNRPLLFPFVTHLLHAVLGYHHRNVFILNFMLMFIFLAGVYVASRRSTDPYSALAAVFFILAYPVFSIYGTSGGYDLFSTFFFALALVLLHQFLKYPKPENFAFLWVSLLMFSNIRYESFIFFVIIVAAVLKHIKPKDLLPNIYVFSLTPLLGLPFIWQRILSVGTYENPPDVPLFSIDSFLKHGNILLENFLNLKLQLPYAGILNLAAVVIVAYLGMRVFTKKLPLRRFQIFFGCILIACLMIMLVIVLSHHFGRYDRPTQARLFMNICIFAALTPIFLKRLIPKWIAGKNLFAISILLFVFYNPIAVNHQFIENLLTTRIFQNSCNYLEALNDRDVLIITPYSGQFTAMNYGAVTVEYANQHCATLLDELRRHRYSKMIAIQEIDSKTQMPRYSNQRLHPSFVVAPLKEIQVLNNRTLRISEIIP